MSDQLTFDLEPLVVPDYEPHMTLAERYEVWREVNGHVIAEFERRTAQLVAAGRTRIGMKMIAEAIRFDMSVRSDGSPWAVNNSVVAFVARDLIARHPDWSALIETRRSVADAEVAA
jgi:hypothetical protein